MQDGDGLARVVYRKYDPIDVAPLGVANDAAQRFPALRVFAMGCAKGCPLHPAIR